MNATASPAGQANLNEMRSMQLAQPQGDLVVDMFSERGFQLAQRIAKAFATSDAVPAQFRAQTFKKASGGGAWIENPAAVGNCLVAIETARAVGMSITAVMQNANIIEGRLSWSAQFVIAAINSSGRFNPLRFQMRNLGRIKAKYREKLGWNDQKRGFDFAEREVEVENIECIAWALPYGMAVPSFRPEDLRQHTLLELLNASGLPVIESAPVSMKMAVEEGWYAKSGSKWQTELRTLMLQYRAGTFFGRIHAPDVVMGMGRTTEELQDTTVIDVAPDGRITNIRTEERSSGAAAAPAAEVVQKNTVESTDAETGEQHNEANAPAAKPAAADQAATGSNPPSVDVEGIADKLAASKSVDELDLLADQLLRGIADADVKKVLNDVYTRRREELEAGTADTPAAAPAPSRRARSASTPSME